MRGPFYEYIEGKGIVLGTWSDFAGEVNYYDYYQKNSNNQLVPLYKESLRTQDFIDVNGNGFPDDNDEYGEYDEYCYYGDTLITEEEYNSYFIDGNYESLEGTKSANAIIQTITGM